MLHFAWWLVAVAAGILLSKPTFLASVFALGASLGQLGGGSSEREAEVEARERARSSARVLLVDDHPFMRVAMRHTLEGDDALEVVGEANDGQGALQRCRE